MSASPDDVLLGRLRAGDADAFDAVYDRFHPRLHAFLARLTGRRDVAEELLQETWLRFASHARALREDTRLGPWLFTVARNLFLSHRRRRWFEGPREAWSDEALPDEGGASPYERLAATELEAKLEAALASLPTAYREVLLLVGVEGMTPLEASVVLGLAPEATRQRLARARGMVEAYLARKQSGSP